jgi:hypothetical protein
MLALALLAQDKTDEARTAASDALRRFQEAGDVSGITLVLDDLAGVAAADGDRPRAGRIWGAARHLQRITGADLASFNETGFGTSGYKNPRDMMTAEELERYGAEGAAMGLDEAVAYALDTADAIPAPDATGLP